MPESILSVQVLACGQPPEEIIRLLSVHLTEDIVEKCDSPHTLVDETHHVFVFDRDRKRHAVHQARVTLQNSISISGVELAYCGASMKSTNLKEVEVVGGVATCRVMVETSDLQPVCDCTGLTPVDRPPSSISGYL